jgi:glycosyltransferase involved in cell wall biosynthesis
LPVYNGESYINQTIESLLAQNFTNFEVLCIDDCSTDSSIKILEYYAKLDSRIRILRMISNQGNVPLVLNKILNEIRGRYVVYSSQDDLFSKDWLMKMYNRAKETGADAVVPDLVFYYENEPNLCKKLIGVKGNRDVILTGREAAELSLDWTIPGNAMWNVNIIRRLRFADFSFNADEYSTREFYFYARKVVFCDGIFYYRQDNPNAITKKITIKNFEAVYTYVKLYEFLKEKNYPFEIYSLEALKAVRLLEMLKIWFNQYKVNLSAAEIETAELSIKRNQDALIALGLLNLH